jgi:hypothetical protein
MATISQIKNRALFTLGFTDEVDFTITTDPLVLKVNRPYEISKNFVLSGYNWRFAQKRAELTTRIEETSVFTAAVSDVLTFGFTVSDGLRVELASSDTLPAGLAADTVYYTVNSSGATAKLSLTAGGAAVDVTDVGTGTHTATFLDVAISPYKYLYPAPSDTLVLINSYTDRQNNSFVPLFEYDNLGLHTNSTSSNKSVWIVYTADIDEEEFPVYFVDYFKYKLALDLCFNLTGDTDLLKVLFAQEKAMLITSRNIDAKQVRVKRIQSSPFIAVRR